MAGEVMTGDRFAVFDSPRQQNSVDERLFADDPQIALLYRHFLLRANWHDTSDRLTLSSASTPLLSHQQPLPPGDGRQPLSLSHQHQLTPRRTNVRAPAAPANRPAKVRFNTRC